MIIILDVNVIYKEKRSENIHKRLIYITKDMLDLLFTYVQLFFIVNSSNHRTALSTTMLNVVVVVVVPRKLAVVKILEISSIVSLVLSVVSVSAARLGLVLNTEPNIPC